MAGVSGDPLDGQTAGDPGGDYVVVLSALDLVLTTTNPVVIRTYQKIVANQSAYLKAVGGEGGAA